ncbi:hypothetical protein PR048_025373 [Dryococelus australis]|uniref:Uncharacterized protein n=1 Tax=Dryococelus australis TaxID=614101 RepID=A0ABQ9GR80_9NEOP|nr:hypothetical protein PR048_025373 [Dryococelus australis]
METVRELVNKLSPKGQKRVGSVISWEREEENESDKNICDDNECYDIDDSEEDYLVCDEFGADDEEWHVCTYCELWAHSNCTGGHSRRGATVSERLDCSPPTMADRVQSPVRSLEIFACGNRAGLCRWSASFLRDLPFTPSLHSDTAPYSIRFTLIGSQDIAYFCRTFWQKCSDINDLHAVPVLLRAVIWARLSAGSGKAGSPDKRETAWKGERGNLSRLKSSRAPPCVLPDTWRQQ